MNMHDKQCFLGNPAEPNESRSVSDEILFAVVVVSHRGCTGNAVREEFICDARNTETVRVFHLFSDAQRLGKDPLLALNESVVSIETRNIAHWALHSSLPG